MKKILKGLMVLLVGVVSMTSVDAKYVVNTSTKTIDTAACEAAGNKVYTNYYLFLQANPKGEIEAVDPTKDIISRGVKTYRNTVYNAKIVNNNIGYGAINLEESALPGWTYSSFYDNYKAALAATNGVFTNSGDNYIVSSEYKGYENGAYVAKTYNFDISSINTNDLVKASYPAKIEISRTSDISNNVTDVMLEITRGKFELDDVTTFIANGYEWYLQPAVYYVQYCGETESNTKPFTVTYYANGGVDAPKSDSGVYSTSSELKKCVKISKQAPKSDKNTFLGWSRNADAVEPDRAYEPGAEYCGEDGDIKLYAVWRLGTGISSPFIAFAIVSVAAVTTLLIAKKKNAFKQL